MEHVYKIGQSQPIIEDLSEEEIHDPNKAVDLDKPVEEDPEAIVKVETSDDSLETPPVQEEVQNKEPEDKEEDDNPYSDYTEAAVYSVELKNLGYLPDDYEVDKEISHDRLMREMIERSTAIAKQNALVEAERRGWTEENRKTLEFLQNGGDPVLLNKAALYDRLSSVDPQTEDEKDNLVLAMYQYRGNNQEDSQELLKIAKDGQKVEQRVLEAKQLFRQLRDQAKQDIQIPEPDTAQVQAQIEQRNEQVRNIIKKGEIGPFSLSSELEQKKLVDFITDKRHLTVQTDEYGNKSNIFVTGLERAYEKLFNNLEKQVVLAKLLMDDFDFSSITSKGKREAIDSALNYLNGTSKPKKKQKKLVNPYLRD